MPNVFLSRKEVMPYYPWHVPDSQSITQVIVSVQAPNGLPVMGYPVRVFAKRVPHTGGHDLDDGNGPVGTFHDTTGQTGAQGEFVTTYRASKFGGIERIYACTNKANKASPEDSIYQDLTVRVPGLILLPDAPTIYTKVGGTEAHHGPPGWTEDHNHWGKDYLVNAITLMAYLYVDTIGEIIRVNDMSLPYGGLFDIYGNWRPPHITHRMGQNADITGATPGSRFKNESAMWKIIKIVRKCFNLNITWIRESDHYHFIVKPRR